MNETKLSPKKETKYEVLKGFITPIVGENRKRANSHENCIDDSNLHYVNGVNDDNVNNSVSNYQQYQSPLICKQIDRCFTVRKDNTKLIESESSMSEKQMNNLKLLRRFSEMKSKLPESHLPSADKDSHKQEMLVDKLQDMDYKPEVRSDQEKEINQKSEVFNLEFPEESLEELAKIDEELARVNNNDTSSLEEETPLVSSTFMTVD